MHWKVLEAILKTLCQVDCKCWKVSGSFSSWNSWGALVVNGLSTGGRWAEVEQNLHINVLELQAFLLELKALCSDLVNMHIQIQSDNTNIVSFLTEMGGSHSQKWNALAYDIWAWCIQKSFWKTTSHIPGVDNTNADIQSRKFNDQTEWKLDPNCFLSYVELRRKLDIDMLACRTNFLFKPYVSWCPDPDAIAIDAFSINLHGKYVYNFSPTSVIPRVLRKIDEEGATTLFIVPQWPPQTWFP